MDKFFYDNNSRKIKDVTNYSSVKTCWTWVANQQNYIKILKCATSYNSQQTFTFDSASGRFCLAAYPNKCLSAEYSFGSNLRIVDVDASTISQQPDNQQQEDNENDQNNETPPENPGILFTISKKQSSFGNI